MTSYLQGSQDGIVPSVETCSVNMGVNREMRGHPFSWAKLSSSLVDPKRAWASRRREYVFSGGDLGKQGESKERNPFCSPVN